MSGCRPASVCSSTRDNRRCQRSASRPTDSAAVRVCARVIDVEVLRGEHPHIIRIGTAPCCDRSTARAHPRRRTDQEDSANERDQAGSVSHGAPHRGSPAGTSLPTSIGAGPQNRASARAASAFREFGSGHIYHAAQVWATVCRRSAAGRTVTSALAPRLPAKATPTFTSSGTASPLRGPSAILPPCGVDRSRRIALDAPSFFHGPASTVSKPN